MNRRRDRSSFCVCDILVIEANVEDSCATGITNDEGTAISDETAGQSGAVYVFTGE